MAELARALEKPPAKPKADAAPPILRRKCACGGTSGADGECAACKAKRLQRKARSAGPALAPPIVHEVLSSGGRPLEASARGELEQHFGHDFSQVRVHTDGRAAASARAVDAQAYTVGRSVVFGQGSYAPHSTEGRGLLAHELAHVVQQGGGVAPAGPLRVGSATDSAERAADGAAAGVGVPGTASPSLQRRVIVNPPAAATQIEGHLKSICPVTLSHNASGELSDSGCGALAASESCNCICDVVNDSARTYTINVAKASVSKKAKALFDGTTASVPETSVFPNTAIGTDPAIDFPDSGSAAEFGSFDATGTAIWAPLWRVLAHELCGHGRLNQSYAGGSGNRAGHDVTIDTENKIAAENGGPARGHFADPKPPGKQGESYFNPVGDRTKIVYSQTNGLHYQAP